MSGAAERHTSAGERRIKTGLSIAEHIAPRDGAIWLLAGTTFLIEQYEDGMEQVLAAILEVEDKLHKVERSRTLDERVAYARKLIAQDLASGGASA